MSLFTTDQCELLYSSSQAGTTSTPTASAVTFTAGIPAITVPAWFMASAAGARASALKLIIWGRMTTTATIPTWLVGLAYTTAHPAAFPTVAAGNTLVTSTAITPSTAATNSQFCMECDVTLRTPALGAAASVNTNGTFACSGALLTFTASASAAFGVINLPAGNGTFVTSFWDQAEEAFLWPFVTLGAATAGNTLTVDSVKLYGERGG